MRGTRDCIPRGPRDGQSWRCLCRGLSTSWGQQRAASGCLGDCSQEEPTCGGFCAQGHTETAELTELQGLWLGLGTAPFSEHLVPWWQLGPARGLSWLDRIDQRARTLKGDSVSDTGGNEVWN